ncbi:MAG: V-type ATPase subunit [Deltaproteobacteria bacterium]|nr:V-type ATPase subunit [Deltaproteobacteria bacterium]
MIVWADLDARARGLAGRLLGRARLEALARSPDLRALAAALERSGYERVTDGSSFVSDARALDRAVRRTMASRLRVLERWAAGRASALAVVFEEEEARNLRALLRGALSNAPAAARLSSTIPTRRLPEGALAELARLHGVREIVAVLLVFRHPYADALADEARLEAPNAFRLEALLFERFAERALGIARGAELRRFVQQTVDLQRAFAAIESAADRAAEARKAAKTFAGSELAPMLRRHADDPAALEDAALGVRIAEQSRAARLDPLGPAPVLLYVLRLRAEAADVRRIIAGVALGAPAPTLVSQLVTV